MALRGYALRAAELAGPAAGLATSVVLLIAGCALLGVAAAGAGGAVVAIVLAALLVVAVFASCDRLALSAMLGRPVSEVEQPELYRLVRELSKAGRLPVPRLYVSPADQPNSFAVGRGPRTATICCTEGLLRVLDEAELRGVLAHDIVHVSSRDGWPHRYPRAWRPSSRYRPAWPGSRVPVTPLAPWPLTPWPRTGARASACSSRC